MELNEALLIVAAIVIMVLGAILVEKYLKEKWKLVLNGAVIILLTTMFIYKLADRFSYISLGITCVFFVTGIFSFYKRYRKYKAGIENDVSIEQV